MTQTVDDLAAFITECQKRIREISGKDEYASTQLWVLSSPQWKELPDQACGDILAMLEGARVRVLRDSGALVP